jgi:hypothetical protein
MFLIEGWKAKASLLLFYLEALSLFPPSFANQHCWTVQDLWAEFEK